MRTRLRAAVIGLVALATVAAMAGSATAAPGRLDPTFAGDGIRDAIPRFGSGADLVVLPDNRILLADSRFGVARLLVNGRSDGTFGTGGVTKGPFPHDDSQRATDMATGGDGRVLVIGTLQHEAFLGAAAYRANGRRDTSFSGDGILRLTCGPRPFCGPPAVAIQPDDRIVIVTWEGGFVIQRLLPNGSPDTTFAHNGVFNMRVGVCCPTSTAAVALEHDGDILAAGGGQLAELTPAGRLVPGFGDHGIAHLPSATNPLAPAAIAIDGSGRILADGSDDDWFVERFSPTGHLDGSFGTNGVRRVSLLGQDITTDMALQDGGRIVVVGGTYNQTESGDFRPAMLRLLPDGAIDRSFANAGKLIVRNLHGFAEGVGLQDSPRARILVAGGEGAFAVAAYHAS